MATLMRMLDCPIKLYTIRPKLDKQYGFNTYRVMELEVGGLIYKKLMPIPSPKSDEDAAWLLAGAYNEMDEHLLQIAKQTITKHKSKL